jgi:hypothetical protein
MPSNFLPSSAYPAMGSVSRWAQGTFTQSLLRPDATHNPSQTVADRNVPAWPEPSSHQRCLPRMQSSIYVRRVTCELGADRARKSGADPYNGKRHRQCGDEGDDNRQGECGKQIYLRLHIVYRHAAAPPRGKAKSRHRDDAVTASSSCTLRPEGTAQWCPEMVNRMLMAARGRP